VYFCIGLQDIDEYGAADAENLKRSIDDAFLKVLELPSASYRDGLISAAADGASVNTGRKKKYQKLHQNYSFAISRHL
jgi:hypothetical protein